MKIKDVLKYFGTATELEREAGISRSTVRNWRLRGYIPIETQLRIQEFTEGKLRANLRHCEVE